MSEERSFVVVCSNEDYQIKKEWAPCKNALKGLGPQTNQSHTLFMREKKILTELLSVLKQKDMWGNEN